MLSWLNELERWNQNEKNEILWRKDKGFHQKLHIKAIIS